METSKNIPNSLHHLLLLFLVISLCYAESTKNQQAKKFLQCITSSNSSSNLVYYTPSNPSYLSTLQSKIWNERFKTPSTPKPLAIITPDHESQIPPVILCARKNSIEIRTRSGQHDFEGLSSTSHVPFIILDIFKMSKITVDVSKRSAWVQAGATIGQLYYEISQKSPKLGFPAGIFPTVGTGGHFSGGGYGSMLRKYGMAADHVIDARIVNVDGQIMDRKSMGEDLFWAIRGGGASFGVITSWKVKLVSVPETVTVFNITRTLEQNATALYHKWQYVAPQLPDEIYFALDTRRADTTITVTFLSLYLGKAEEVLALMDERFPELGVRREDLIEVSWIQSALFLSFNPIDAPLREVLTSRDTLRGASNYLKGKSDYVQEPISVEGIEGIWRRMFEDEAKMSRLVMIPFGGRMARIPESFIPFPHRAGNLYEIGYQITWDEDASEDVYMNWMRRLYSYMGAYVSKNPRFAYYNYKDLDLGVNNVRGNTSYAQASVWGYKYFNVNNFNRLVEVKTKVDPTNFFKNEQSIPPLIYDGSVLRSFVDVE